MHYSRKGLLLWQESEVYFTVIAASRTSFNAHAQAQAGRSAAGTLSLYLGLSGISNRHLKRAAGITQRDQEPVAAAYTAHGLPACSAVVASVHGSESHVAQCTERHIAHLHPALDRDGCC